MLDLVGGECERVDSRFLEPACGSGNFLVEILRRRLAAVKKSCRQRRLPYEPYALLGVSCLYGIDILADTLEICRGRLFALFEEEYRALFKKRANPDVLASAKFLLARNIVHGDALTMRRADKNEGICFTSWGLVDKRHFSGEVFRYCEIQQSAAEADPLLQQDSLLVSDEGRTVFIARPVKRYPLTHYAKLHELE